MAARRLTRADLRAERIRAQRVPPWSPKPSTRLPGPDEAGAKELADKIRAAWRRVGREVSVWVEYVPSREVQGGGRTRATWRLCSETVGGLPRG